MERLMHEVIMPKMGLSMETGTIEKWYKAEGDTVEEGDILLEITTDKVNLEVEAYNSGTLLKIVKQEGTEVPVTEIIAYIGEPGEKTPEIPVISDGDLHKQNDYPPSAAKDADKRTGAGKREIKISPIAKRFAKERGIDIAQIKGSGPEGRIVKEDVERYVSPKTGCDSVDTGKSVSPPKIQALIKSRKPLTAIRKIISERLTYSAQNIPHIITNIVVNAGPLVSAKQQLQNNVMETHHIKLTLTDFIVKAAARVLKEQPIINSSYMDASHLIYEDINVGLAVDADSGLIVPTIYSADKLPIHEIGRKRLRLIEKINNNTNTLDDISNSTFTISNLGMYGIRSFTAIINPPQGAILMIGEVYEAPVVIEGSIEIGTLMNVSLAVDHRILDGADAARFLNRFKEILENADDFNAGKTPG